MIGWLREFRRESKRAYSLKVLERRKRVVGFTTYGTVWTNEGFRNRQQITEEIFCALLRPYLYDASIRNAHPDWQFEMDALPDGAMRVSARTSDQQVVAQRAIPLDDLVDYENGYDGGLRALQRRIREGVGA